MIIDHFSVAGNTGSTIMKAFVILSLVAVAMAAPGVKRPVPDFSKLQDRRVLYPGTRKVPLKKLDVFDERIVGGVEVAPHSYPHQVALSIDSKYFCGGSLIDSQWVVTAAHCTDHSHDIVTTLGAHNLRMNEASQVVVDTKRGGIFTNPDYNAQTIVNDIGLIKLPTIVQSTDAIAPASIGSSNIPADTIVTPTGWGLTSDGSSGISDVLMKVDVPTISNQKCEEVYGNVSVNENVICVTSNGGHGTCNGDSGGPMNYNGKIIALTSYGAAAGCEAGYPDVFTRIDKYETWIRDTIAQNS